MDFYKKLIFSILAFIFCFSVMIKLVEPVIERQLSKKLMKEVVNSTENFTPEKRILYKKLIKKIYLKWIPLLEEARSEALKELNQ